MEAIQLSFRIKQHPNCNSQYCNCMALLWAFLATCTLQTHNTSHLLILYQFISSRAQSLPILCDLPCQLIHFQVSKQKPCRVNPKEILLQSAQYNIGRSSPEPVIKNCFRFVNLNFEGSVLPCCLCKASTVQDLFDNAVKLYHRFVDYQHNCTKSKIHIISEDHLL